MLTEQDFLDAGYKRYNQSHRSSDYMLQKRIDDEVGKKYFINVYVYDWREYKDHPSFSFAPEVQFPGFDDDKMTVNVSFIVNDNSTIKEIEKEFEGMWKYLGKPYYERNM